MERNKLDEADRINVRANKVQRRIEQVEESLANLISGLRNDMNVNSVHNVRADRVQLALANLQESYDNLSELI